MEETPNIQKMRSPLYFKEELSLIEEKIKDKLTETVRSMEPSED